MSRDRSGFTKTNRTALAPVVTKRTGPDAETVETHPAYGQIMVFKTSGMKALYGSDFAHQNYVSIEISESELHRNLCNDWPYARKELIRINMSEAQWGSMVSSFGVGMGTQCTIDRKWVDGRYESMPDVQLRDTRELYKSEGDARLDDAMRQLEKLRQEISAETSGLSKAKQATLLAKVDTAQRQIGPNIQFVKDQFGEHLEERTEKAKTEIMAWMNNTISRAGMDALGITPPLQIAGAEEDEDAPHVDIDGEVES